MVSILLFLTTDICCRSGKQSKRTSFDDICVVRQDFGNGEGKQDPKPNETTADVSSAFQFRVPGACVEQTTRRGTEVPTPHSWSGHSSDLVKIDRIFALFWVQVKQGASCLSKHSEGLPHFFTFSVQTLDTVYTMKYRTVFGPWEVVPR
ncbi:hypothetical protein GWI33_012966 [Rhynchophorus ferrugineus]|uniref:Uncharacterized protein n=1 Tax=Rhynchophorus ferrugineus TaxID=354439 RepID=A0A834MC01_RHYFE|nr:hypothetical protein GWI33_012966 [Rhynchophorus ferrugineus]